MAYETIQDFNVTNLDGILVYVANAVPIFIPALLIFIWVTVTLLVYMGTRKFSGNADIFAATASSGFLTAIIGVIMTLTFGIINIYTLALIFGIVVVSFIMLIVRRNRD